MMKKNRSNTEIASNNEYYIKSSQVIDEGDDMVTMEVPNMEQHSHF